MNLNLHGVVRGAITSVNSDIPIGYLASVSSTTAVGGKRTPTYAETITIMGQVQPVPSDDLGHFDFLQSQGIYKSVYLYGISNAIVRSLKLGGDLLSFPSPEIPDGCTWLVKAVPEAWATGWCRVLVVAQLDPNNPS
jgi:hypothetical protein